jgi:ankyrin repeat protein
MKNELKPEDAALRTEISHIVNPTYHVLESTQRGLAAVRKGIDGESIIGFIKQASPHPKGPLAALGIGWSPLKKNITKQTNLWIVVMRLLMKANPEDGLFLTDALVKTLPSKKEVRHELCSLVLAQPDWRIQAIERHPDLFVPTAQGFLPYLFSPEKYKRDAWDGNPFVILAALESVKSTKQNVAQTILALEKIGAVPGVHKEKRSTVLHKAAEQVGRGTAQSLGALAEHFHVIIDAKDREGNTPLHLAVKSGSKDNVAALLKAGASTQVIGMMGDSPLDEAVKSKNMDVIQVLCTHGEHDWSCVKRARSWAMTDNIRAYMDAQLSRLALDEMMKKAGHAPQ